MRIFSYKLVMKIKFTKADGTGNDFIIIYDNYSKIKNLSSECVQKLQQIKPETLGQASRLAGVRPSDIAIIAMHIKASN